MTIEPNNAPLANESFDAGRSHQRRIEELEFIVTHLQKNIDDLNEALLLQDRKIAMLSRQVELASSAAQSILDGDPTPRSLADDKPPHY